MSAISGLSQISDSSQKFRFDKQKVTTELEIETAPPPPDVQDIALQLGMDMASD